MGKNILFSRMLVNNEIGFIDDDVLRGVGVPHSDLTQAIGNIPVDVKALNIDYGSFSAHKFHGLKGVGVLYVKDPTSSDFKPYHYGGQQEFNLRAGTENVIGISAMGVAIEDARGILPTNICTNIMVKHNLRSLSDMLASRASHRTQDEYRKVCDAMYDACVEKWPWIAPFLRDQKSYALKELESIIHDQYDGTDKLVPYLKLIDLIRNAK